MTATSPKRRQALKYLGAAPLASLQASLPAGGLAMLLPGIPQAATTSPAVREVSFTSTPLPDLNNPAAMATTWVQAKMTVDFKNGKQAEHSLQYQPLLMTGDLVPDGQGKQVLAGGYYDINNAPIMDTSVAGKERQFFSDCPDGTSLLSIPGARVAGVRGNTVFAVVQFEYTSVAQDRKSPMYGRLPSPIAILTLDQDRKNGHLKLVKYHNVDTSPAHGLWITCGASLSPWGTHISSEEYEPNAFGADKNPQFKAFSRNLYGDESKANPYHYGHVPEVTVRPDGTGVITKHFCMGRISHELVQVMPDNRTVLMGDDATNSGYFVFVADRERDLSSGTLYVAKIGIGFSLDPSAPAANMSWIKLGSASSAEIHELANTLKPEQILDLKTSDPGDASYTRIHVNGRIEWMRILPGMEKAAAFLETHRYAAWRGASMTFTKMEGTTVNIHDKTAYSALQNCEASMVAGNPANPHDSAVSLPKKLQAGAIMALKLAGGFSDETGQPIASEWMPMSLQALLTGQDMPADALGNTADTSRVANPDNLKYSEAMRTLFIGEDSSQHVNNMLWAYNVDTKKLSRIMSIPAGGESTGLHVVDTLNGWTYIMSNFQHAGDWGKIHQMVKSTLDPLIDANYNGKSGASVGYISATGHQMSLAHG